MTTHSAVPCELETSHIGKSKGFRKERGKSFSDSSLFGFGFWLPLFQLICASFRAVVGDPFYVPKIISAICGGVLVYGLTWELTFSKWTT
jgi:hypothetical protein